MNVYGGCADEIVHINMLNLSIEDEW